MKSFFSQREERGRQIKESDKSDLSDDTEPSAEVSNYSRVVGIGASAGGLEALRSLLARLPNNSGMTFIVAQHLSPTHHSLLVELLARETSLPVREIRSGISLTPNTIFITPPNRNVFVDKKVISLEEPIQNHVPKPSVNKLFLSLAHNFGSTAIGIILSGTGHDGSEGIRAIKAAGGITYSQEDSTAKYSGMPRSALETGAIDYVLSPEQIASHLAMLNAPSLDGRVRQKPIFEQILNAVRRRTSLNFLAYKENSIRRRMGRRMSAVQKNDLPSYLKHINERPEELDALASSLLISVTNFFRDKASFDYLARELDVVIGAKKAGDELRIWIPGCATGEEAYSVAMLVEESLKRLNQDLRVQIFATDIDRPALDKARKGIFSSIIKQFVPPAYLKDYFFRIGNNYQISKRLRDMIVYSYHDVVQDPPFLRIDLISFRNVLIYLKPEVQKRIFAVFHFSLRPGGFLFLGKSESPLTGHSLFSVVSEQRRLYRRLEKVNRLPLTFSSQRENPLAERTLVERSQPVDTLEARILKGIHESIIPAGVLIDEQWHLHRVFGDVSPYLRIPSGNADFNLLMLLTHDLRLELKTLVSRVCRSGKATSVTFTASVKKIFQVHASILPGAEHEPRMIAIYFQPLPHLKSLLVPTKTRGVKRDSQIRNLEQQLGATREHLQTVIEELETSNEELQSVNEELQASNEELQSTNEEFQTTNEELESTNEELTTVNEELITKTTELKMANSNLENVKDSVDFPLVVVDELLRLTVWNPAASRIFSLDTHSFLQPLGSLIALVPLPNLVPILDQVLVKGTSVQLDVEGDRHYILHIRPFRESTGEIKGAVLTFFDDTELRESQLHLVESAERLKLSESFFRSVIDALPFNLCVLDQDGNVSAVNQAWANFAKRNDGDVESTCRQCNYLDTCARSKMMGDSLANVVYDELKLVLAGKKESFELEYPCHNSQGQRWFLARFTVFEINGARRVVVTHEDITERLRSKHTTQLQSKALDVSHDGQLILSNRSGENKIVYANHPCEYIFGKKKNELLGTSLAFPDPDNPEARLILSAIQNRETAHALIRWNHLNQTNLWLDVSVSQVELDEEKFTLLVFNDVTDLVASRTKVKEALEREHTAKAFAEIGTFEWELDTGIVQNSEINLRLFGLSSDSLAVPYKKIYQRIHPAHVHDVEQAVRNCLSGRGNLDIEFRIIDSITNAEHWLHCRGDVIRKDGHPVRVLGMVQDVTQRRMAEEKASHLARHDSLTGLPNRSFFRDRLSHAIAVANRKKQKLALLFVDLDNFKNVNDSFGHHVGDLLLQSVAERLAKIVRVTDTVARQAGDEYIVLLSDIRDEAEVSMVAEKFFSVLSEPHAIQGHNLTVTPSIGISIYPDNGQTIEEIMKNADSAMYQVKVDGRSGVRFFTQEMDEEMKRRVSIMTDLRHASDSDGFFLDYQPQIDVRTGECVGTEALLRWNHPHRGLLLPGSFIPVVEEGEAICRIGAWVIRQACLESRRWNVNADQKIPVAINLAPQQLKQKNLLTIIEAALETSGLPSHLLELELTERALIRDPKEASELLKHLRAMGIQISIDDFGTGYSSLAYLKKFPIDKLKIDRSFVSGLPNDPEDVAIVRAIVQLGKNLNIFVVAEGVECFDQYEFLMNIGCGAVQGYLISKPVLADRLATLLQSDLRPEVYRSKEFIE